MAVKAAIFALCLAVAGNLFHNLTVWVAKERVIWSDFTCGIFRLYDLLDEPKSNIDRKYSGKPVCSIFLQKSIWFVATCVLREQPRTSMAWCEIEYGRGILNINRRQALNAVLMQCQFV